MTAPARLSWSQPVCVVCWNERNPGRTAHRLIVTHLETCCYCGTVTGSGIYQRVDPTTVPYPTRETT